MPADIFKVCAVCTWKPASSASAVRSAPAISRGAVGRAVCFGGKGDARRFDLYISGEVVRELSSSDFPEAVRAPALEMLVGLPQLAVTDEVIGIATVLVRERVMPSPTLAGDALHVAVALVHQMDYLVTWNQQHLANQNKRVHLQVVCARLGYLLPEIVTPDLMFLGDSP